MRCCLAFNGGLCWLFLKCWITHLCCWVPIVLLSLIIRRYSQRWLFNVNNNIYISYSCNSFFNELFWSALTDFFYFFLVVLLRRYFIFKRCEIIIIINSVFLLILLRYFIVFVISCCCSCCKNLYIFEKITC